MTRQSKLNLKSSLNQKSIYDKYHSLGSGLGGALSSGSPINAHHQQQMDLTDDHNSHSKQHELMEINIKQANPEPAKEPKKYKKNKKS